MEDRITTLQGRIEALLSEGLSAGEDFLAHLPLGFSKDLAGIEAFLNQEDHPDRDWVLAGIFTPTLTQAASLEPAESLSPGEEARLAERVSERVPLAQVLVRGMEGKMRIKVPSWGAVRFVKGFFLERSLPSPLLEAAKILPDPLGAGSFLALARGSRVRWTKERAEFLTRLLERTPRATEGVLSLWDFFLHLMEESGPELSIKDALLMKRSWCLHHLSEGEKTESSLLGTTFEERLGLGIRPPYVDQNRMEDRLLKIESLIKLMGEPEMKELLK